MSKLHVTQIEGYLSTTMKGRIDVSDYAHHSDPSQVKKAFLTRGLAALAASHMTETPIAELGSAITDGSKDGGIDLVYFNAAELTLDLVQTKWHEDGHGTMELGEVLKSGEISILYFDKKFSHAVRKTPKDGDFRIQSIYGGKYEPYYPSKLLLQTTQKIIDFIQDDLLYARVDGIIVEGVFYLMELELIEPDLYLDYVHNGTEKFADAIDQFMNKIKK